MQLISPLQPEAIPITTIPTAIHAFLLGAHIRTAPLVGGVLPHVCAQKKSFTCTVAQ